MSVRFQWTKVVTRLQVLSGFGYLRRVSTDEEFQMEKGVQGHRCFHEYLVCVHSLGSDQGWKVGAPIS